MTTILTTRKKRTKRKIGPELLAILAAAVLICAGFGIAQAAERKPKAAAPTALIAGTVFRGTGLSLAGARLSLEATPEDGSKSKFKKINEVSDSRGEFAIRVPAVPMRYVLTAGAEGFETLKKPVTVQGEERIDVTFVLSPRAKGGK